MERHTARYERADGGWMVRVDGLDIIAFARTLEKARFAIAARLAEHLHTFADHVPIDDEVELARSSSRSLEQARTARGRALEANAESNAATKRAAQRLVEDGLSYRDAGYLLGLSHSRIQQLLPNEEDTR